MRKSNWRKEIELSEFRTNTPADPFIGAAAAGIELGKKNIAKKITNFLTPKSFKTTPKVDTPKTDTNKDGYKKLYSDDELLLKKSALLDKQQKERGETDNKRGNILKSPNEKEIDKKLNQ